MQSASNLQLRPGSKSFTLVRVAPVGQPTFDTNPITASVDLISEIDSEVYDRILSMLYEGSLSDVRQLSKYHDTMVARMFYGRFCRIIHPFHLDGGTLLLLLRKHSAVISGSAALLMLHPGDFVPGDLDIFVTSARAVSLVLSLVITSNLSYYLCASSESPPHAYDWCNGVEAVHWLRHRTTAHKINVVVVTGHDPLLTIVQFDATHVMNFITCTGFGSAYPRLTMDKVSLLNSPSQEIFARPGWVEKHRLRGFRVEQNMNNLPGYTPHSCTVDPSCPNTIRHIRDHRMMYASFQVPGIAVEHALPSGYSGNIAWGLHSSCGVLRGRENCSAGVSGGFASAL